MEEVRVGNQHELQNTENIFYYRCKHTHQTNKKVFYRFYHVALQQLNTLNFCSIYQRLCFYQRWFVCLSVNKHANFNKPCWKGWASAKKEGIIFWGRYIKNSEKAEFVFTCTWSGLRSPSAHPVPETNHPNSSQHDGFVITGHLEDKYAYLQDVLLNVSLPNNLGQHFGCGCIIKTHCCFASGYGSARKLTTGLCKYVFLSRTYYSIDL